MKIRWAAHYVLVCLEYIELSKVSETLQQRGQAIDMQGSEDEGEEMKWRWREERGDNVEITSPGTDSIAFWHSEITYMLGRRLAAVC